MLNTALHHQNFKSLQHAAVLALMDATLQGMLDAYRFSACPHFLPVSFPGRFVTIPILINRNLTGNNLLGGLPSNWGQSSVLPLLRVLDLSKNPNLSGALPPNWGAQGAFPTLQTLSLESTGVSGQLPLAWGVQQSLPQLIHLDLSNNILAGLCSASKCTFECALQLRTS